MIVLALFAPGSLTLWFQALPWFALPSLPLGHQVGHHQHHAHVAIRGFCFPTLLFWPRGLGVNELVVVKAVVRLGVGFRNSLQLPVLGLDI